MADNQAFGGDDRYYSRPPSVKTEPKRDSRLRDFSQVLHDFDPDLRSKVERTFNQWNNILRDYLRNETGLRLSVGEDKRAVPVRINDGLPVPFERVLDAFPDPQLWSLYLYRGTISSASLGLQLVDNGYEILEAKMKPPLPASIEEIGRSRRLFEEVDKWLQELDLLKRIGAIDQDILGAYFFRIPEVRLYWMVIGLVAGALRVSVEALTFVVAAHELAHAYTHLGRDIDGRRWDMEAFARADSDIVEGLAQFYTRMLCEKIIDRFPAAQAAYKALLGIQKGAYTVHESWGGTEESTGEVVRFTLIETRSRQVIRYTDFERELEDVRHRTARSRAAVKKV